MSPRAFFGASQHCSTAYKEISQEIIDDDVGESLNTLGPPSTGSNPKVMKLWHWAGQLMMILLALGTFVSLAARRPDSVRHQWHTNYKIPSAISCDCGKSVAEAKLRKCRYDTLAACWLPDACRDDELSAQFDKAGPNNTSWVYFADKEATRRLSIEELSRLPDSPSNCFWVSQRWHLLHCTFYWKKLHRQAATGVVLERHYNRMGHIEHCEMMLLNTEELDDVTEAAVGLSGDGLELGPSGGCSSDQEKGHMDQRERTIEP